MNPMFILGVVILIILFYFVWKEFKPDFKLPLLGRSEDEDIEKMLKEKIFLPKKVSKRNKKDSAPVSGKCYKCSKKTTMPYKCKFCGHLFCSKHRLPESHDCEGLKRLRRDKE